jgi:methylglutaconyl-CoA hydratase
MIADTAARIAATRTSADGKEGIRSFLEKRKPAWTKTSKPGTKKVTKGKKA